MTPEYRVRADGAIVMSMRVFRAIKPDTILYMLARARHVRKREAKNQEVEIQNWLEGR